MKHRFVCRHAKASKVARRGPQKTGKERAFGGAKAEDASPTRVSVLLEVL
jgi:hypothetical protein